MSIRLTDIDSTAELLERRWFAALKAVSLARSECKALLETIECARAAWDRARLRLAELENLRDSLGDELASIDAERDDRARRNAHATRRMISAA